MGIGLAQLGNELRHEFDARNSELSALRIETANLLSSQRRELILQMQISRDNQRAAIAQLRQDTHNLLSHYRQDIREIIQSQRAEYSAQRKGRQALIKEEREEMRGWQKAIRHIQKKRTGR